MRRKAVEVLANLKNIVILDCDKEALYKQVAQCFPLPALTNTTQQSLTTILTRLTHGLQYPKRIK